MILDVPEYISNLVKNDWKLVGQGSYSTVLEHHQFPYLVRKVSPDNTDPWQEYILWAKEQDDMHLPTVFNIEKYDNCMVADIEKLEHMDINITEHRNTLEYVTDTLFYAKSDKTKLMPKTLPKIVKKIKDTFQEFNVDMHEENIMLRNNVFVITDPFG